MAITITCAGCNTAFEVPDNLAGKTIRCTSCKTQVTIPSAAEAAAASKAAASAAANDGRKPFGHGGAPVKSAPAQPPAAKTAPKSAPASAAKAAPKAKAVVEDEEEEEKEKAKPSKPPAKSTTKAAAKKRRDDDDDDDDDDRPARRKKKNEGAGGAMIGIIAAGAIGLAAIVGVGLWLAMSGDKKPETASSSSSSSSAGDSKPAATPGAMPGRPSGAPGTTGAGAALPGESPMGGMPPVGMGAGGMPPVGMGGMPPAGMGAGAAPGGAPFPLDPVGTPGMWATFNGAGFTAEFPGAPVMNVTTINGRRINFMTVSGPTFGSARVGSESLPGLGLGMGMGADEKQMVEAAFQWSCNAFPFLKTMTQSDVTVDGHPGKDIEVIDPSAEGKLRLVAAGDRVFVLIAGGPTRGGKPIMSKDDVNRFINSVKITYKLGDPVAAGPGPGPMGVGPAPIGMGMGMPPMGMGAVAGMPPGGMGAPPVGMGGGPFGMNGGVELADGNFKAKVEPFFTAAFDMEKKEVFALELRAGPGGRALGHLARYDYSNLQVPPKKYKMASLGFRVALDSKNELLYVATATAPNAMLVASQEGRASAPADIAVYDLKAIREGKAADGKPIDDGADIKAAWTVTLRNTVHGMELSPDGKSLYVLVHSSQTKKSALVLIDTAMKKEAKRAELPEPVRDLVAGGDDRTLLIIEDMNPKAKASGSGVRTFDTQLWQLGRSIPMRDGPTLDVGPMTSGGMVVSVLPLSSVGGPAGQPMGPGGPMGPMGIPPMGPGGPGGPGRPMGPGGMGSSPQSHFQFQLALIGSDGGSRGDMDLGAGTRAANGGYVKYDPTNKKLFVGTWSPPGAAKSAGLDVYDVTDLNAANGVKLKVSLRTAKRVPITGHFLVSPDGKYLLFNNGLVLEVDNLGGAPPPAAPAGGMPGGMPAGGMPMGMMPMGGMAGGVPAGMPMGGMPGMPMPGAAGAGGAAGGGRPPKKDN